MKTTKKITGAVAAIALILTTVFTFAFKAGDANDTASKTGKRLTSTWYYQLNSTDTNDINNPENYSLGQPDEGISCGTGSVVCSIQDVPDSSDDTKPALTHGNVTSNPTPYSRSQRVPF
ncbi:MAG: hypothetical protein EOO45_00435 [Flavobacterium sp.]|nr:MAG: hypothetical protein EOO45_00435 [Flavobacterium sp.]